VQHKQTLHESEARTHITLVDSSEALQSLYCQHDSVLPLQCGMLDCQWAQSCR